MNMNFSQFNPTAASGGNAAQQQAQMQGAGGASMMQPYLVFYMPLNTQFSNMNLSTVPQGVQPGFMPRQFSGQLPQVGGIVMGPPLAGFGGQQLQHQLQYPSATQMLGMNPHLGTTLSQHSSLQFQQPMMGMQVQQCQSQTNLGSAFQQIQPVYMPQRSETDTKNLSNVASQVGLSQIDVKSIDNNGNHLKQYSNTMTDLGKQTTGLSGGTAGNKSITHISLMLPRKDDMKIPIDIFDNQEESQQSMNDDSDIEDSDSDWGNKKGRNQGNKKRQIQQDAKSNLTSNTSKKGFSVRIPLLSSMSIKTPNNENPNRERKATGMSSKTNLLNSQNDWLNEENRYMKNEDQVRILESEFAKDPHWSKQKMQKLSKHLNLKESQIYKWNWDRRQMQDRYIQKRIENKDLPENLFKVTKVNKNETSEEVDLDDMAAHSIINQNDAQDKLEEQYQQQMQQEDQNLDGAENQGPNGYLKILRSGNIQKI